jgi:leucyl aminopeptidase
MVSETALLPGDIITSMSGKSVEIVNTDAEGRLVMADAMWYAQEQYDPEIVLNIATLTGSKIRAIGDRYAAVFSDDEELITQLTASGKNVNEPIWRLPLAYGDMLKSTLADSTNIGSGGPGATTAQMFIKQFVQDETRWVSLDIAGNELANKTKNEVPAGGVGYGVRLLTEWLTSDN